MRAVSLLCLFSLMPLISVGTEIDADTGLNKEPGWELVKMHCGGCHSFALITNQRADRQTWLSMIRWMQQTQNLWSFSEDDENQILDYLAGAYPPRENRRRAPIPRELMPDPL